MVRKSLALIFTGMLLILPGCNKAANLSAPAGQKVELMAGSPVEFAMMESSAGAPRRFIAARHKLEVVAVESELPKAWESVIAFCDTIHCEVVSSSIATSRRDSPASGNIFLRVSPEDLKKLLAYLEKHGSIVQHTTETEDKTSVVVDTEAKIKNLTSFRDNLRTMLARPSASVKNIVEIQQQLTEGSIATGQ
ncbi:MAG TPA: DUF4349 domain-containing protein [Candidatus Acidoferrum sp.]|nr:DUF4349 domain-containing protein [Candidatus Acidoferrum sp.]